eukprot:jgi/Botrbrau1/9492/Bobra.0252s0107.1
MVHSTFATVAVLTLQVLLATAEDAHPAASPAGPVTLASLKPPIMYATLSFNISGKVSLTQSSCTTDVVGSSCLPQVQAARDTVLIHYGVKDTAILPHTAANISLAACYSNFSQIDRPWRKSAPTLDKDKSCPFKIVPAPGKRAFSPLGGNATWKVPGTIPEGTYYIRAILQCTTPKGLQPCGMGTSLPGFFQVNKIDSVPGGLVAGSIVGCLLGPAALLAYFAYERMSHPAA